MVPILISKDVFEPSHIDLKLTMANRNYICTNLIVQQQHSVLMDLLKDDQLSQGGGGTQTQDLLLTSSLRHSLSSRSKRRRKDIRRAERRRDRQAWREDAVKTRERVMWQQRQGLGWCCQTPRISCNHQRLKEAWRHSPLEPSEGARSCWCLDLGLLAPELRRNTFLLL